MSVTKFGCVRKWCISHFLLTSDCLIEGPPNQNTLTKVIKGGSLMIFPKFSRPSWTKMSEISVNTVKQVNAFEQIGFANHFYYKITVFIEVQNIFGLFTHLNFKRFHPILSFDCLCKSMILVKSKSILKWSTNH